MDVGVTKRTGRTKTVMHAAEEHLADEEDEVGMLGVDAAMAWSKDPRPSWSSVCKCLSESWSYSVIQCHFSTNPLHN